MSEWFETLPGLFDQARARLSRGVRDRRAPSRHPTLATVDPEGAPEARTVVLRAFEAGRMTLDLHTDLYSSKIASLRQVPHAALHVWEDKPRLQLRLTCDVTILSGEEVAHFWAKVPDPSRQSYGISPAPGTPIGDALAYVKNPDPSSFAVLRCEIRKLDLVHLGDQHRRAVFARHNHWVGHWLSP